LSGPRTRCARKAPNLEVFPAGAAAWTALFKFGQGPGARARCGLSINGAASRVTGVAGRYAGTDSGSTPTYYQWGHRLNPAYNSCAEGVGFVGKGADNRIVAATAAVDWPLNVRSGREERHQLSFAGHRISASRGFAAPPRRTRLENSRRKVLEVFPRARATGVLTERMSSRLRQFSEECAKGPTDRSEEPRESAPYARYTRPLRAAAGGGLLGAGGAGC